MVVGAHAGDAELMAGGIACKVVENNGEAIFVHMSLGERGHPRLGPEEYGLQKRREAEMVAEKIGAKIYFMNCRDGYIEYSLKLAERIGEIIRSERPDVVLTHWKGSLHLDHINTYRIVLKAIFLAANKWTNIKGKPWYSKLYFAENWEDSNNFIKDIYIDFSNIFEKWINAVNIYGFVRGETGFPYKEYYTYLSRIRGIEIGVKYAQTLMKSWYTRKTLLKI